MYKQSLFLLFNAILILSAAEVLASEKPETFYDDRRGGYYWYEEEKTPEEKEPVKKEKLTPAQLWELHPKEFNKLREEVTQLAIQKPTEENVMAYLQIIDIAKRKSLAFSSVVTLVGMKHPELSGNESTYPITAPGQKARNKRIDEAVNSTILNGRKDFALIMFTQEGCGYCTEQKQILSFFEHMYQWPVRRLDKTEYSSMAQKFNVEIAPTILAVYKQTGDSIPVSNGVVSLAELKTNIYRAMRVLRGDVTPQETFMHDFQKPSFSQPEK